MNKDLIVLIAQQVIILRHALSGERERIGGKWETTEEARALNALEDAYRSIGITQQHLEIIVKAA